MTDAETKELNDSFEEAVSELMYIARATSELDCKDTEAVEKLKTYCKDVMRVYALAAQ